MHFTLPHKNKKKTAVRHTFQTFITLSHWFLIFVNKRGVGGRYAVGVGGRGQKAKEDEKRGGAGGRGTETTVLLRRGTCKQVTI